MFFRNGRWRSQWAVQLAASGEVAEVTGLLKVQVHYYEEGNVQLVSSKEVKESLNIGVRITFLKCKMTISYLKGSKVVSIDRSFKEHYSYLFISNFIGTSPCKQRKTNEPKRMAKYLSF